MKRIKNNPNEGFLEMLKRLDEEDHGKMTKEEWDSLKDKWMKVYDEIKHKEKNPLLLSYEDIQKMY
jgi:hypothetical protein